MHVKRDGMTFWEDVCDDPEDIYFYGDVIKTYIAVEPFEVDGIIYDPMNAPGNTRRPMVELIADRGY